MEYVSKILAGVLNKENEDVNKRKQEIISTFKGAVGVFKNEDYVFFKIMRDNPRITPTEEYIKLYLQTQRAVLQNSKNINLVEYRLSETDPYVEFALSCVERFKEYTGEVIVAEDFELNMEMAKMTFLAEQSITLLEQSSTILTEGVKIGYRELSGYKDMRGHLAKGFQELDNIANKTDRKGVIAYSKEETTVEDEEESRVKKLCDFGITALDEAIGGIYEGDMVSILAPPKGAKSRFTTYILHNAKIQGTNIAMWSVENGYKGWEYLIRARHFNWYYNRNVTDVTQIRHISADMIRKGTMDDKIKELEQASWEDLRFNPNYGEMINIDADFNSETYEEQIKEVIDIHGAKVIGIDYLQLMSGSANKTKAETIGDAYKNLLQLGLQKKVAWLLPGQIKQTAIGDLERKSKDGLGDIETRDMGGETAEIIRTPSVNLLLYGTPEDIRNGSIKLVSIPSRNSSPFEPIDMMVDAGSCTFQSVKAQAV